MIIYSIVGIDYNEGDLKIRDYISYDNAFDEFQTMIKQYNEDIKNDHYEDCGVCAPDIELCHCDKRHCRGLHKSDVGECEGIHYMSSMNPFDVKNPYDDGSIIIVYGIDEQYLFLIKHEINK